MRHRKAFMFVVVSLMIIAILLCEIIFFCKIQSNNDLSEASNAADERGVSEINSKHDEKTMMERISENNAITRKNLSDEEYDQALKLSAKLPGLSEAPMVGETAYHLSEAFIRCIRLFENPEDQTISAVSYAQDEDTAWEYWTVTSSSGMEYWFWGFSFNDESRPRGFVIDHVTIGRGGELLMGAIE